MKVFNQKDYEYIGVEGGWHCFKSRKINFDPEIVLVYRAKMIKDDGTSVYYDPIEVETESKSHNLNNLLDRISLYQTSMCVIDPAKVKRKPKWNVAEGNGAVRFEKVSP